MLGKLIKAAKRNKGIGARRGARREGEGAVLHGRGARELPWEGSERDSRENAGGVEASGVGICLGDVPAGRCGTMLK